MEQRIPIPTPIKGLNVDGSFGNQPMGTLRAGSKNVRCVDPITGRVRLSQRAGMSKFNANQVNAGQKIDDLAYVVFDNKRVTYAELASGDAETVWSTTNPAKTQTRNIVVDRQSNVYALSGTAGIVKLNSGGTERFKIAVPVDDPAHALVALFVDDLDDIYTGVGSGGNQRTAAAWKYTQGPDPDEFFVVWKIVPGGYIEDIVVKEDKAYLSVNFADENRSQIQVYDTLDSPTPRLVQTVKDVPYPTNGLDVNSVGEIFTAHPFNTDPNLNRPSNPKAPGFRQTTEDWNPRQLANFDERCYRWHDAEKLEGLSEGDPILEWKDLSGHDRHLFANFGVAFPPTYAKVGVAGKPSLRFEADNSGSWTPSSVQGLMTRTNPGTEENTRGDQQTLVPANQGAAFTLYMVVRMVTGADLPEVIWGQRNNGTGDDILRAFIANRNESNNRSAAVTDGEFSVYDEPAADAGGGTNGHPISYTYSGSATSTHLITYQCDGGVNPGVSGTTATRSILRVDGNPVDRWESESNESDGPSFLGNNGFTGNFVSGNLNWGGFNGQIPEIFVLQRTDYTSTAQPTVQTEDRLPDAGAGAQTDNEMTRIEGYLMHKWGIQGQAPTSSDTYPHPYGDEFDGFAFFSGPPLDGSDGIYGSTLRGGAMTIKWSPSAEIIWSVESKRDVIGGIGVDVKLGRGDETNVYTLGDFLSGNMRNVRRMIDNGSSVTFDTGTDYWAAVAGGGTLNVQHIKIDTDLFDNVYVPLSESVQANSLYIFDKTGDGAGGNTPIQIVDLNSNQRGYAVAADLNAPEYGDDAVDIAEFVYLATENNGQNTTNTIFKLGLVEVTATTGSYRTAQLLAVSNGTIKKVAASGAPSIPTGGSGALSTASNYIESTVLNGVAYFVDGTTYKQYKGKDDAVTTWKATSGGQIPPRCRLITNWRNRIVLAGDPDNGSLWHMSAQGEPDNWDQFPPEPLATQAISGNNQNQTAGMVPDIINTMIPFDDDILIFGGDHSIWKMTGDPMAGGELDLVSDITGIAFGRPWAKDPDGVIYFVGSRGGLYRMTAGSRPERISQRTIERLLNDSIDFSTHFIRMFYNWDDEGLHILQFPFDTVSQVKHFFWDSKHDAPYEDSYSLTSTGALDIQPTAGIVIDGDAPDDRAFVLGCSDSYLRKWDRSARDDDGTRIVSKAIRGPLAGSDETQEYKFDKVEVVLAPDQQGVTLSMFASDEAVNIGVPVHTDQIGPGRNGYSSRRMRGSACWISYENGAVGQRWSEESASIRVIPAGRKRIRSGA